MSDSNEPKRYLLRLYTADQADKMAALAERFREVLAEHAPDHHQIEVVDVILDPERAIEDNIFMTPTAVRALPEPIRRVIGDVSDASKVLSMLGVFAIEEESKPEQKPEQKP